MPATRDLHVYRGDRYEHQVTFQDAAGVPLNMTGTWRAHIRKGAGSADTLATFAVDVTNAATGVLVLSLTAEQTAALPNSAKWDLEETTAQRTYLRGTIVCTQDVSR